MSWQEGASRHGAGDHYMGRALFCLLQPLQDLLVERRNGEEGLAVVTVRVEPEGLTHSVRGQVSFDAL